MNNPATQQISRFDQATKDDIDCVVKYIKRVWNQKRLSELAIYLDEQYVDHSMPYAGVQNREGLRLYLDQLAKMASHQTEIIEVTTLGQLVICHIKISAKALIEMDNTCQNSEEFYGYRMFKVNKNKITEHWEIL